MLGVEGRRDRLGVELGDGQRELVPLADVAEVERGGDLDSIGLDPLAGEDLAPLLFHLREQLADPAHVGAVDRRLVGAHEVVLEVGHEHPRGAEDRRLAGNEEHRDLELVRDRGRVHGAGPAGNDEREVARIEAAAHAHLPDARCHGHVDEVVDAGRRLHYPEAERPRQPAFDRLLRRGAVEAHLAPEERVLVDEPEHEVGVGDGRLGPSAPVAGGTG